MKPNPVKDKSFNFAVRAIKLWKYLMDIKKEFILSKQLIRSGTSIWANIREAQSAESRADFIHKFKIADKEITETDYWLTLCQLAEKYPFPPKEMFEHLKSIKNVASKIIISSKGDNNQSPGQ